MSEPKIGDKTNFVIKKKIGRSYEFAMYEGTILKFRTVRQMLVQDRRKKNHWVDCPEPESKKPVHQTEPVQMACTCARYEGNGDQQVWEAEERDCCEQRAAHQVGGPVKIEHASLQ